MNDFLLPVPSVLSKTLSYGCLKANYLVIVKKLYLNLIWNSKLLFDQSKSSLDMTDGTGTTKIEQKFVKHGENSN